MRHTKGPWEWQNGILRSLSVDEIVLTSMAGHPKEAKNYPLIAATPELLKVCNHTFNALQATYRVLNFLASGESMKQWSRVEPQGILAEIYGILATPFNDLKQTISNIERKELTQSTINLFKNI